MATATMPRAKARTQRPSLDIDFNASSAAPGEMPDVTFRASLPAAGKRAIASYSYTPGDDGPADAFFSVYIDAEDADGFEEVGIEEDGISPSALRTMATLLAALADEVEHSLAHRVASITERYARAREALDDLYCEDQ